MQVQRIQSNYNNYNKRNIYNSSSIGFHGVQQKLIPISADSFRSEYTQKLFSKIQKYFQLIGDSGNIKEVRLLQENIKYCSSRFPHEINSDADVCLSINKGDRNSNLKLYYKFPDGNRKDMPIFDVALDKNGQMFRGQFFPNYITFERDKRNIRRMYSAVLCDSYLPLGSNDKEWSCLGDNLSSKIQINDSEKSAFEIFIELARLKTAII